ncbi:MAG: hypothetical protein ACM3ON_11005 [Chloroflexota bacterium]
MTGALSDHATTRLSVAVTPHKSDEGGAMGEVPHEHLIAYVRTSKVTDWKRLALRYGDERGPAFVYRSDDDTTFAEYARSGTVLWVIESHLGAPPSLVARLQIVAQLHARLDVTVLETAANAQVPSGMLRDFEYGRKLRWYAVADPECSRFFGYNDVSTALLKTELDGKPAHWRGADKWWPKYGQSLQRPRRIKSGAEELEMLARHLAERSVFLSWKHDDFKERHPAVRELVNALVHEGIDCWWDELALPPSRAITRLRRQPELLTRLLDYGLTKSTILLALGSPNWGTPSSKDPSRNWTRGEWDRSRVRVAYEIDGPPSEGWPSDPRETFSRDTPVTFVVRSISDRLDEYRHVPSA